MPEFYVIIVRKIFLPIFLGQGGARALPAPPVSYAYATMMQGVRYLFTTDGQLICALDQLEDGGAYVCSSTMTFRHLDYETIQSPTWIKQFKAKIKGLGEFGPDDDQSPRDFIVPRTVCVFRAGPRPRNRVKMLLNRRTAHTYDQLLTDIAHAIHVNCSIKCIYTTTGRSVFPRRFL